MMEGSILSSQCSCAVPGVVHPGTPPPRPPPAGQDIGSVVRNPEISAISETLLAALAEPSEKTKAALDTLSTTAFVHAIDAPSLAIIVPILK